MNGTVKEKTPQIELGMLSTVRNEILKNHFDVELDAVSFDKRLQAKAAQHSMRKIRGALVTFRAPLKATAPALQAVSTRTESKGTGVREGQDSPETDSLYAPVRLGPNAAYGEDDKMATPGPLTHIRRIRVTPASMPNTSRTNIITSQRALAGGIRRRQQQVSRTRDNVPGGTPNSSRNILASTDVISPTCTWAYGNFGQVDDHLSNPELGFKASFELVGTDSSSTADNGPSSFDVSWVDSSFKLSSSITISWAGWGASEVASTTGGSTVMAPPTDARVGASELDAPNDSETGFLSEPSGDSSTQSSRMPTSRVAWCAS
ncbi:unnamed protein product [Phytophthora fragariaefolia]|uniref:Unnamed protein product n=1 Tax=Phytophthora fragariaefolia TaxID=1490495 RepID=A0A9W6UC02_9STRA|nr:unnamed protein product [Phytophthora fragariaefolia]